MPVLLRAAVLVFAFNLWSSNPAHAVSYQIIDLGVLPGDYASYAYGLNNASQVVGASTADCCDNAFLYSGGMMTNIGTLGGSYASARGISDAGHITGWSGTSGDANTYAFLYSGGTMTSLGALPGDTYSLGGGVNSNGYVIGLSVGATDHGFLYDGSMMIDLGSLGGNYTMPGGINEAGQVVGASQTGSGDSHAFLYANGIMTDLGTLGGTISGASDINNHGVVVGNSYLSGNSVRHAFLHDGNTMIDLGTLGGFSTAYAINDNGYVVGYSVNGSGSSTAFLHDGTSMHDLHDLLPAGSPWELREATDINNLGQITGSGIINGANHAFLMTPVPVPVPSAVWLFLSGLGTLLAARGRVKAMAGK